MSETNTELIVSADSRPHLRRNFTLGVINGGAFVFAESLMSIDTVLTWFVDRLGGSNFLIGLVGPMRDTGWYLPQLFVSHRLQRQSLKQPLYRRAAVVRMVAWTIWTLAAFLLAANYPALLFVFLIAYGVNAIASGFAGLPFLDIVAKTIPTRQRGSFFGARLFTGGVIGLAASVLVGLILAESMPPFFPQNVGVLFVLSWIAAAIGLAAFSSIKEPAGDVRDEEDTLASHLQRAARLPRHNHNLRYLLIARVVILMSYVAKPFYTVYSINVLQAPAVILGLYLAVRTALALLSNPLWSRLSNRHGNKIVVQRATVCGIIMLTWAVFSRGMAQALSVPAEAQAYLFVPVFALMGIFETGVDIGAVNLTLEVAPADDRAIYLGLTNTVLGVAYFSTIISGLIVDWIGYQGVFVIGLLLLLVAVWALSRLREPRECSGTEYARR